MAGLDLLIKGGTVVDGSGAPPFTADVAVRDANVVAVGRIDDSARRTVSADGLLVTPGWVDIHTHYDGQATWDDHLQPSSWHGVTTVVMGNCGVGFAPVRQGDQQALVELMEGVEDIPGTALHEGLSWEWESFAEYLDTLDARPHDVEIAAQVPHGPLRLYVMGDRGARGELASSDDIAEMGRLAREAIAAGALGFTTSRTKNHRTSTGAYTPTLRAEAAELVGIASEIGRGGTGVIQMVSDFEDPRAEVAMIHDMMARSGRPLSLSLAQGHHTPSGGWRASLAMLDRMYAEGLEMRGQVAVRPIGLLIGLQATVNPLQASAAYREAAATTADVAALARELDNPSLRERVLAELRARPENPMLRFELMFPMGDRPDYEPGTEGSIAARAAREGVDPLALMYDELRRDDGRALVYVPIINYATGNLDHVAEMLQHPHCVPGLSDGGAHVGTICDASFPTTLLQHWGRDRPHGRLPLSLLVSRQCRATAEAVGLLDRGVLMPGRRADINVIDLDALAVERPTMAFDLPAGGKRLLQRARGYCHTFVGGVETYHEGEATGERPGRLVRGRRKAVGR